MCVCAGLDTDHDRTTEAKQIIVRIWSSLVCFSKSCLIRLTRWKTTHIKITNYYKTFLKGQVAKANKNKTTGKIIEDAQRQKLIKKKVAHVFTAINWSSLASTKVAQFQVAATDIVHVNKKIKSTHYKLKQTFTATCCSSAKHVTETSICVLFCNAQQCWQVQFQDATTAKIWTTKQLNNCINSWTV